MSTRTESEHRNAAPRPSSLDADIDAELTERFRPDVDELVERSRPHPSVATVRGDRPLTACSCASCNCTLATGSAPARTRWSTTRPRRCARAGHHVDADDARQPDRAARRARRAGTKRAQPGAAAAASASESTAFRPDVVHVHNTWFALSSSAIAAAAAHRRAGRDDAAQLPARLSQHRSLPRRRRLHRLRRPRTAARRASTAAIAVPALLSALQATEIDASPAGRASLDASVTRFVAPSQFMADRLADIGRPDRAHHREAALRRRPGPSTHAALGLEATSWSIGRLARARASTRCSTPGRRARHAGASGWRLHVIGDGPLAADLAAACPAGVDLLGWRGPRRDRAVGS